MRGSRDSWRTRAAGALAVGLLLGACGGGGEDVVVAPVAVEPSLAPAEVQAGERLRLIENTDDATLDAFANGGETSLMADGRLWELRRAERLVGTLQITTLLPTVDLLDESRRSGIVRGVMAGSGTRVRVGDVEVHANELADRAQYVWFGMDVVQILTVREEGEIEPEAVLRGVLDHQRATSAWKPLPVTLEERDSR